MSKDKLIEAYYKQEEEHFLASIMALEEVVAKTDIPNIALKMAMLFENILDNRIETTKDLITGERCFKDDEQAAYIGRSFLKLQNIFAKELDETVERYEASQPGEVEFVNIATPFGLIKEKRIKKK